MAVALLPIITMKSNRDFTPHRFQYSGIMSTLHAINLSHTRDMQVQSTLILLETIQMLYRTMMFHT